MCKYDVIIAGSGLAGLECAAILSKEGFHVCVLEKNPLIGGCFQTFSRYGRHLDTGIHYIGSLDEGQLLHTLFKYLGIIDKLKLQKLDADGFDIIHLDGKQYRYAMGYEHFAETLAQSFPREKTALRQYVAKLREVGYTSHIDHLRHGVFSEGGYRYFFESASAFIDETTSDPTLRRVLSGTSQLYGGVRDQSPLYCHAMVNNSYIQSAYRLVGGSMQVTDALTEVVRNNGGKVINNAEITRFITNGDRVTAVEVNNKVRIEADNFISTIHPQRSLLLIDETPALRKSYKRRIASMPNSYGVFTLYLIMKPGAFPYENFNRFLHGNADTWYIPGTSMHGCLISSQLSDRQQQYADVISILSPTPYEEVKPWENTTVEHRGEDYKAYKQRKTQLILEFVRRHGIDYDGCVEHMLTSSPLTYRDYTATAQGAAYGFAKDYKSPHLCFLPSRTHLSNFFFAGQSLNVHGALGVSLTSMLTCAEFVGQDYLAKKIGNA